MAESKVMTLSADGASATVRTATVMDVVTTAASTTEKLTGTLGLVQDGLKIGAGMAIEAKMRADTFKPKLIGG